MAFAETCPQYLFLSLDDMGNGFEGSKFVCSPPLREKDPNWEELWTGLRKNDLQVVSTDHCPFDFHGQKELGRGDFRKIPNGLPGVEDRVDLLHDGGVVAGRISKRALGRDHLDRARRSCSGCTRARGDRRRRRRGPRRLRPEPEADDQRAEAHHMDVDYSLLRGPPGPGRVRRRAEPRVRRRPRRRVHRRARATAGSSSAGRPTTPGSRRPRRHEAMFVTLVHCHVKPEHLDAFLDATRANHEASSREAGNLRFDVIRPVEDPTRIILYEWYRDEAAALPTRTAALLRLARRDGRPVRRAARGRPLRGPVPGDAAGN